MLIEKVITLLRYYYNIRNIASYTRAPLIRYGAAEEHKRYKLFDSAFAVHVPFMCIGDDWELDDDDGYDTKMRRDRGARTVLLNAVEVSQTSM